MVAHAEQAPSLSAVGDALRPDAVELPGAIRWVGRRVRLVHHVLSIVIGFCDAGELWMSDVMHGPKVSDRRKRRKTYLIAFIDDATFADDGRGAEPFLTTTAVTIAINAAPAHACAPSPCLGSPAMGGTM